MPEDETRVREARAAVFLHHAGGRRAAGRAFAARGGREAPGADRARRARGGGPARGAPRMAGGGDQ